MKFLAITISASLLFACSKPTERSSNFNQEKEAILKVLNDETEAAFQRDYEAWQDKWVHETYVCKTYLNFADSTFSESLGWTAVAGFVKQFLTDHPDPEPSPALLNDIEVRLYSTGAFVTFQQMDQLRGLKRETRLMEKIDGEWKIAGMHTTIYGKNLHSQ